MKTRRPIARVPILMLAVTPTVYYGFTAWLKFQAGATWDLVRPAAREPHALILVTMALTFGLLRASSSHPRFQAHTYAKWLSTTPWKPGRPLPLGPVVWVWEDVVAIGILAAISRFDAGLPWFVPVIPYVLGRLAVLAAAALMSGAFAPVAGIAAVVPLLLMAWRSDLAAAAVLSSLVLLDFLAVKTSLADFPWSPIDPNAPPGRPMPGSVTWPANRVGPSPALKGIAGGRGIALALLAGWWAWSAVHFIPGLDASIDMADWNQRVGFMATIPVAIRLVFYVASYHTPISWWGRFRTGRLVIPGYDRVFVTPAIAAAAAWFAPRIIHAVGGGTAEVIGGTVALVAAIVLLGGPTLRNWQLTGHHRIWSGVKPTAAQAQRRRPLLSQN